jgi:hypothetical protein
MLCTGGVSWSCFVRAAQISTSRSLWLAPKPDLLTSTDQPLTHKTKASFTFTNKNHDKKPLTGKKLVRLSTSAV